MAQPLGVAVIFGLSATLVSCVVEDCSDYKLRHMPSGQYAVEQIEGDPLLDCEIVQVDVAGPADDVVLSLRCNELMQKETWRRD